ncbi:hypothetical protein K1T71_010163 [Dendrolimus kikuchii]|uniref:Uncharacterized protein n=1 Tax=Dendrolimus kikuchii TaxID=765133 RepID=A0ACC1CR03_9NEOP|nr:hypothetical protein K1T71_010163 [Dendrolimus kikuchii]
MYQKTLANIFYWISAENTSKVKMKILLLALFIAVSTANPIPDDEGGPVDVVVNGVAEGEPLEISDIVDIHVNQHVDGVLTSAMNVLHPYSAAGIAEAAAEAAALDIDTTAPEPVLMLLPAAPDVAIVPEPVVMPSPATPEVVAIVPEPVIMPSPAVPEVVAIVPEPVVMPPPAIPEVVVEPEPVVMPEAVQPEVMPEPAEKLPVPAPQIPQGEVYNDGTVQVSINTPQGEGVIATLQSWLNVVLNYFSNDVQSTQQIL